MSVPSRRYLSVWLRRLPTDRIERRCGLPGDAPLIVVEPVKSALRVCALNDAAARLGLHRRPAARRRARDASRASMCAMPKPRPIARCSKRSRTGATAIRRWWASMRRTACCSIFPAARICSAAKRRSLRDMARRLWRQGLNARFAVADSVGCAWAVARFGDIAIVPKGGMRGRARYAAARGVARGRRDRRRAGAIRLQAYPRCGDAAARAARRAVRSRISCAASIRRSGARRNRSRRACRSRPARPSSVSPSRSGWKRDVLGTIEKLARELVGRDGAARRGRAPACKWLCSAPTERCSVSMPRPARRCAIRRASRGCFPSALRRLATKPIPASATTCCGCRRSWSSAWTRCRPGLRATITPSSWRI